MLNELLQRYPVLEEISEDIKKAADTIKDCYEKGGKVLLCGNGGSSADCEHIAGELMKGFLKKRPVSREKRSSMKLRAPFIEDELISKLQCGLPAISLPSMTALNSAFSNDVDPELIYAQSLMALGDEGDVLIAISTSGNSKNICAAAKVAKALGVTVIGLTGKEGGMLGSLSDVCICAPETETFKVQELHLPIYHYICAEVEAHFFD